MDDESDLRRWRTARDQWTCLAATPRECNRFHPGIFPQPSLSPFASRLAPGFAKAIYPSRADEDDASTKPCILVGGDEAGKVWLLIPTDSGYEPHVIFDINVALGAGTTQIDNSGVSISTIGSVATRYDRVGPDGMTELFIPVFEGRKIYVYSFHNGYGTKIECTADETIVCPAGP